MATMPEIDLNELKKRDPLQFHQRMLTRHGGELLAAKDDLREARDSRARERAQDRIDQAKADIAYQRRQIERLTRDPSADS